jgi:hypothetical protein
MGSIFFFEGKNVRGVLESSTRPKVFKKEGNCES